MATKKPTKKAKTTKVTKARSTQKKRAKAPSVQSLRLSKSQTPFMTMSPNRQSLYWIILGVIIIGFATWILKLQSDIDSLYDSISANTYNVATPPPSKNVR